MLLGCPQEASDPEPVPEQQTLVLGPEGLVAKAEEGVNFLWWNSLDSIKTATAASPYNLTIVRRDTVTQRRKDFSANTTVYDGWNGFIDAVDWNNQLINGRVYEYILRDAEYETVDTILLTAKVPDRGNFQIALTEEDIEVKEYKKTSDSLPMLLVSFPSKPNLTYQVKYTYGQNQVITRDFGNFALSGSEIMQNEDDWFSPRRAAAFPLLGGTNTIAVWATFIDNKSGGDSFGRYYDETKVLTKQLTSIVAQALAKPSFAATSAITQKPGETQFKWTYSDASVTDFEIYKAEVSDTITDTAIIASSSGNYPEKISVKSDWVKVDLKGFNPTASTTSTGINWEAREYLTDPKDQTKRYIYALFAKRGDDYSQPAYGGAPAALTTPATPGLTARTTGGKIQLTWNVEPSHTAYILEYAKAEHSTSPGTQDADDPNYRLTEDYKPVDLPGAAGGGVVPSANYIQGKAVVDLTPPAQQNYVYRLTARINEVNQTPKIAVVSSGIYTTVVALTPTQVTTHPEDAANTIRVELKDDTASPTTYFGDGRTYTIELYRREIGPPETLFTKVSLPVGKTTINAVNQLNGGTGATDVTKWFYLDTTNVDITKEYQYKVVLIDETGKEYGAKASTGITTSGIRPIGYEKIDISNIPNTTFYQTDSVWSPNVTIPANSIVFNNGSNLKDLAVKVTITRPDGTLALNGEARTIIEKSRPGLGGTTEYIYYITLPAKETPGTNNYGIEIRDANGDGFFSAY
jgi:hypothetical protein